MLIKLDFEERRELEEILSVACDEDALTKAVSKLIVDVGKYRTLRNGSNWPAVFASHDAPEPLRGDDLDAAMEGAKK